MRLTRTCPIQPYCENAPDASADTFIAPAGNVTLAHDGEDVVVFAMTVKMSWQPPVVPLESY